LRGLGYEFADMELHEGWLFLEESSAEVVIEQILIPNFALKLKGRLRTFSSSGVTNMEPSISAFQRLITFVHLEPVYQGKVWVRTDGDEAGLKVIATLREKFAYFNEETCAAFSKSAFEFYYPEEFSSRAKEVCAIVDKAAKRKAKLTLLKDVLDWSNANCATALPRWENSAAEIIKILRVIENAIT
jgi:hypothetical protein